MGPSKKGKEREEPFLRKADGIDKAVAGTQMAAGAIGAIGALAPVPFIKDAADAALYIAQIVKDVKNNREEFEYIAQDATSFVDKINQACLRVQEKRGELAEDLVYDLGEFVATLKKLKVYAQANTHRRLLTRWLYKDMDPENIRRCREELGNHYRKFEVASTIQLRADMATVVDNTGKILANLEANRRASDPNVPQQYKGSSPLAPQPDQHRPTSAPPAQGSPPSSPSAYDDPDNPFSHIGHPNFPFNRPQRQSQPVFNVTASTNFNAPNSMNYKSGNVNNQFSVGHDDFSNNVYNYGYDGGTMGQKMAKMERKMAQKFGSPQR